ncbi:sensor histidine kinase [Neolewinella persica]|uniref:sensor histidine kinase n=1 Tax=Neolewinella persica TaxID=70998 RepID=UPI0003A032C2|nr:sensor histidine kinase [Neolewinella persica]
MHKIVSRLEAIILKGHTWIFIGIIMFFALVLVTEREEIVGMGNYLSLVFGLSLIYAPVLWFVSLRPQLKERMGRWTYRLLWGLIFCGYPLLLLPTGIALNDLTIFGPIFPNHYAENTEGLQMVGGLFFAAATALFVIFNKKWIPDFRKYFGPASAPKIIGLFALFAAFIAVGNQRGFDDAVSNTDDLKTVFVFLSSVWQTLMIYLPYLALFYFHHHFLYRKLLATRGIGYYLLGVGATILVYAPIHAAYALIFPITAEWGMHTAGFVGGVMGPENHALAAGFMIMSLPVILLLEWFRKTRTITLLEKEKTATELDLLKQQVNPHFFFNTLNNLYALSLRQAPETPETVLQLSELMRYVIYKAKDERVQLQEEVKYLQDYLDLQRIRLYQDADIDLTVNLSNPELAVPPLLFIILVENAFKHGIEPSVGECFLQMELTEKNGHISFVCHNSLDPAMKKKVRPGGVGLQNLQRRLELLYPDRFEIVVDARAEDYRVMLNLWEAAPMSKPALALEELVPEFNEHIL